MVGFVQKPASSITVAGILTGGHDGDLFDLKITRYGDITSKCTKLGDEYNPMSFNSSYGSQAITENTIAAELDVIEFGSSNM